MAPEGSVGALPIPGGAKPLGTPHPAVSDALRISLHSAGSNNATPDQRETVDLTAGGGNGGGDERPAAAPRDIQRTPPPENPQQDQQQQHPQKDRERQQEHVEPQPLPQQGHPGSSAAADPESATVPGSTAGAQRALLAVWQVEREKRWAEAEGYASSVEQLQVAAAYLFVLSSCGNTCSRWISRVQVEVATVKNVCG